MLDTYLREGETIEGRIDELLNDVRASGMRSPDIALARLTEASVLAHLIPAAVVEVSSSIDQVIETAGEPLYTTDDVAKALDGVFEGGQAPTVLRGALLALLAGREPVSPVGSVEDTALLNPLADGTTPRLPSEEAPQTGYIDTGSDFDVTMPDHADDFPEFAAPEADPLEATITKTKKGGKKNAAQRAAEEAGA